MYVYIEPWVLEFSPPFSFLFLPTIFFFFFFLPAWGNTGDTWSDVPAGKCIVPSAIDTGISPFDFYPLSLRQAVRASSLLPPPPPPLHLRSLLGGFCFPSHLFTAAQGCVHLAVAVSQTENTGSWFSDRWREAGLCGRIYMCSGVVEVFMARIFWGGGGGCCSVYVRQHGRKLSGVCVCVRMLRACEKVTTTSDCARESFMLKLCFVIFLRG